MAMTPLERKRLSLTRKAEREKLAGDPTDAVATIKFYEFVDGNPNWEEVRTNLEWGGVKPDGLPVFVSDDDPDHDPDTDGPYRGSIGRAERMVGAYLDAATELAGIINRYKREEIDQSIAKLEQSDLSDPTAKKKALAESARLHKLRAQLDRQVRRALPQWEVKGD
ncbi:hypothetical protein [Mesorhizobium sp. A623]